MNMTVPIIKPGSALDVFQNLKKLLLQGQLIGLPTETVYGLAGDATNNQAVSAIYALKKRPTFNPLICHFSNIDQIADYCIMHPQLPELAAQFWPGPLTVILKRKPSPISPLVFAGLDTLAIRIPDHPVALELIECLERPLAAPSANPSETISPTTAEHVLHAFAEAPQLAAVLDGGPCRIGVESTILDLSQKSPIILRPGAISHDDLCTIFNEIQGFKASLHSSIQAPGMSKRHYAPSIPMRLNVTHIHPSEALLAFGTPLTNVNQACLNLSQEGHLHEAAANLFKMLRELDRPEFTAIAVMPIPQHGIGIAINDRLQRAAVTKTGRINFDQSF